MQTSQLFTIDFAYFRKLSLEVSHQISISLLTTWRLDLGVFGDAAIFNQRFLLIGFRWHTGSGVFCCAFLIFEQIFLAVGRVERGVVVERRGSFYNIMRDMRIGVFLLFFGRLFLAKWSFCEIKDDSAFIIMEVLFILLLLTLVVTIDSVNNLRVLV